MNPVELSDRIKKQYIDYLRTTFYLKDPLLRASFASELERWQLVKGPYLQATPTFRSGRSLSDVYSSVFSTALDPKIEEALTAGRPLYSHQDKAISKVLSGRNVVVSTGTGSGKTESFLLPILIDLYRQQRQGKLGPGVRALVLYPMNALANDQRDRLVGRPTKPGDRGGIAFELEKLKADFQFTIGQYIGETPEDAKDSYRLKAGMEPGVGELLYRQEMRRTPPNILLTNFSMLEYLLLRPNDSPLFDRPNAQSWTYLVLDEAHQYRGAMGIEMAMLIRRLKQRLREEGCENQLRCIATSASLVNGDQDIPAVANFASELFGEPFDPADVILGDPVVEEFSRSIELQPGDYVELADLLSVGGRSDSGALSKKVSEIANRVALPLPHGEWPDMLGALLLADRSCANLKTSLAANPSPVSQLGLDIFPRLSEEDGQRTLMALVDLLLNSREHSTGNSLLSARFHLFLRSLEGAFVVFDPQETISLERRPASGQGAGYELALCRECGQHYLVGRILDGRLGEAKRDPSDDDFGAEFFLIRKSVSPDKEAAKDYWTLCLDCGAASPATEAPVCRHSRSIYLEQQEAAAEKEDQIPRCMECSYHGRDPVREVIHGTDGPHAVIATTLFKNLPRDRNKVLAFADGRQEAAFFAWYLEQSYKEMLDRCLIVSTLKAHADVVSEFTLTEFAPLLVANMKSQKLLPKTSGDIDYLREACKNIYKDLLTDKQRISPEGVGLIQWSLKLPVDLSVPESLLKAPWNLDHTQAKELISVILDTLRTDHAIELDIKKVVGMQWGLLGFPGSNMRVAANAPNKKQDLKSWAGKTTRRAQLLEKSLRAKVGQNVQEIVDDTLREIWDILKDYDRSVDSAEDKILIAVGDGYRLNAR